MTTDTIPIPTRLVRPHAVVLAARDALVSARANEDGRLEVPPQPGMLRVVTSRALQNRALRIAQAVVAEAQRRGYDIVPIKKSYNHKAGAGIAVDGHNYPVEIVEQTDRFELTSEEVERCKRRHPYSPAPSHRYAANGKLRLATAGNYGSGRRSNVTEGPRGPLEGKLGAFLAELEQRAVLDAERHRERQRREVEHQRQLAEQRAHARP